MSHTLTKIIVFIILFLEFLVITLFFGGLDLVSVWEQFIQLFAESVLVYFFLGKSEKKWGKVKRCEVLKSYI